MSDKMEENGEPNTGDAVSISVLCVQSVCVSITRIPFHCYRVWGVIFSA